MAVSEAIYGSTTSYISSNGYYGYVPPNNILQPVNTCGWDLQNVNMKQLRNGNCHGAMETDDDSRDAALVNNYCVIPEALRGLNPAVFSSDGHDPFSGFGALDRQTHQDAARRRNRKRNNDGELVMPAEPDQFKRLRKGSGNSCTYHGRGHAKDGGLAEVCYKSARLGLSRGRDHDVREELTTVQSCCWAAGNLSPLVNYDHKRNNLPTGSLNLNENDAELEKMLLETHGCSAYHHQQLQSQNGIAESEF